MVGWKVKDLALALRTVGVFEDTKILMKKRVGKIAIILGDAGRNAIAVVNIASTKKRLAMLSPAKRRLADESKAALF